MEYLTAKDAKEISRQKPQYLHYLEDILAAIEGEAEDGNTQLLWLGDFPSKKTEINVLAELRKLGYNTVEVDLKNEVVESGTGLKIDWSMA